jgi:hypothetical protein
LSVRLGGRRPSVRIAAGVAPQRAPGARAPGVTRRDAVHVAARGGSRVLAEAMIFDDRARRRGSPISRSVSFCDWLLVGAEA